MVRLLLEWKESAPKADVQNGEALVRAAENGHMDVVEMLLEWGHEARQREPEQVSRIGIDGGGDSTTSSSGSAGVTSSGGGGSLRADCQDGEALVVAAEYGHEGVVRLLLGWDRHAPRPDCQGGIAMQRAEENGHLGVAAALREAL